MTEYSDEDPTEEQLMDAGSIDSAEEGFLKGYTDEEEIEECAECGGAVAEEKKVVKDINGESYTFCSAICAEEFEEEM